MIQTIDELQKRAFQNSNNHGFWEEHRCGTREIGGGLVVDAYWDKIIPEKLALIHSEVSEALEEIRSGKSPTLIYHSGENMKPEGFPIELADALIRIGDLAEAFGIDLTEAVNVKHQYNLTRPHKHGRTC